MVCVIYNSYAHVAMYLLFALMLPDWRSMHYILNCSSYLKYRLCVSLRFNLSWHDFTANIKYAITCTLIVAQIIAYTVVIHGHLDTIVETRCPGGVSISCLASRSLNFSYSEIEFYKYSWSFLHHAKKSLPAYLYINLLFQIVTSLWGRSALDNLSEFGAGHYINYRLHVTLSHRRIRIVFLGI